MFIHPNTSLSQQITKFTNVTIRDQFELLVSAEFALVFVFGEADFIRPIDEAKSTTKFLSHLTAVPVILFGAVEKENDVKRNVDRFS